MSCQKKGTANMIQDEAWEKSNGKKAIEVLTSSPDGKVKVWVLAMATDLRLMNNDRELVHVEAIRVRSMTK